LGASGLIRRGCLVFLTERFGIGRRGGLCRNDGERCRRDARKRGDPDRPFHAHSPCFEAAP
jgi:hypothetical protein